MLFHCLALDVWKPLFDELSWWSSVPRVPQWLNVWSLTESFPAHACWTRCYKKSKQFNVLALFILRNIQVTETTVSRSYHQSINLHWISCANPWWSDSAISSNIQSLKRTLIWSRIWPLKSLKGGDGWVGCFYQIILCNFVWTKLPSPLSIRSLFEIDYFPLCWEKCAQMWKITSKSLNWHP